MMFWTVAAFVAACLGAACGSEETRTYYVDTKTGCQVYHFLEGAFLTTLICPNGEAFELQTRSCEPAERVDCSDDLPEVGSGFVVPSDADLMVLSRPKRSVEFFDIGYHLGGPLLKGYVRTCVESIFGTDNTVSERVILPSLFEMLDAPTSRHDVFDVVSRTTTALMPIKLEILRQGGGVLAKPGTTVQISVEQLEDALYEVVYNTKPQLLRLLYNHFTSIKNRVFGNLELIQDSLQKLADAGMVHWKEVLFELKRFAAHHKRLAHESTGQYLKMYSMSGLVNDLMPVGRSLMKLTVEYLRKFPNSIAVVLDGGHRPYRRAPKNHPFRGSLAHFFRA